MEFVHLLNEQDCSFDLRRISMQKAKDSFLHEAALSERKALNLLYFSQQCHSDDDSQPHKM
jgi:hypothetical protein